MLKNKRNNKIKQRAKVLRVVLYISFCVIIAGIGVIFYAYQARMPLYISPLPKNFVLSAQSTDDRNMQIIKSRLKELNVEIDEITKSQDAYTIKQKNNSVIILSTNKDIKLQLSSLQFILTRLTMEGRAFSQLDLRFDKPVIRFK